MCVYIFRTGGSHAQSPPRHQVTNHPTHLPGTPRSSVDTCRFSRLGRTRRRGKALQRLVASNELRRIDRGLYDFPRVNALTGQAAAPDYRQVIDAVGRRDQVRVMIDGITAANDPGLTHAVPGQVVVHTDGRLRPIQLDQMTLKFKLTSPSKLYWAGRPAMRVVQALHWLKDSLKQASSPDQEMVMKKLVRLLQSTEHGNSITEDLQQGLHALPAWMQAWVRDLLARSTTQPVGADL